MKKAQGRVALITGASSGIGRETARLFSENGYIVYGASRRAQADANVIALSMDVTDEHSVFEGVERIFSEHGRIDVLVHCAGNGFYGPIECSAARDMYAQMDVNLFAAQRLVNAVLPGMRERRCGLLLFVGSVGGMFAIPYQTLYSCSKAALAIYTEGLRLELKPFHVHAAIIEPGDVKTGFTAARAPIGANAGTPMDMPCPEAYQAAMQKAVSRMAHDEQNGMPPLKVARAILRIAQKQKPPAHTIVGGQYRLFAFLKRLLPYRLVEWLLYKMYLY